jgi:large subunit ribosomal protein L40e
MNIQIFINISGQMITLDADESDTIESIKAKIQDKKSIPASEQNLFFNGIKLEEGRTLADYNISRESIIYLTTTTHINTVQSTYSKYYIITPIVIITVYYIHKIMNYISWKI